MNQNVENLSSPFEDEQQFLQFLQEIQIEIDDESRKIDESRKNVVLIGATGAGKSTIYCGLKNNKLKVTTNDALIVIEDKDQALIGHEKELKTKQINLSTNEIINQKYIQICDTPGFGATGSQNNQNFLGIEDIRNSALIKYSLEKCQQSQILLVLDFRIYQNTRDLSADPFMILFQMIPHLSDYTQSVSIVINKSDRDLSLDRIIDSLKQYYIEQNSIVELIEKINQNRNIVILPSPSIQEVGKPLDLGYFDKLKNLILKNQGVQFKNVKVDLQNGNAMKYFIKFTLEIDQILENLLSSRNQKEQFIIPDFNKIKKNQEKKNIKNNIELKQSELKQNLIDLKFKMEYNGYQNQLNSIQYISNLILKMENQANTEDIMKINKYIQLLSIICVLEDNFLKEKIQKMCQYFEYQLSQYLKFTTQKIQDCRQLKYDPKESQEFQMLVAREVIQKGRFEKLINSIFTLKSCGYKEYYYVIINRDNGQSFIEERIYINQQILGCYKQISFDSREQVKAQITTICSMIELQQIQKDFQIKENRKTKQYLNEQFEKLFEKEESLQDESQTIFILNLSVFIVLILIFVFWTAIENYLKERMGEFSSECLNSVFYFFIFDSTVGILKLIAKSGWEKSAQYILELNSQIFRFEFLQNPDLFLKEIINKKQNLFDRKRRTQPIIISQLN